MCEGSAAPVYTPSLRETVEPSAGDTPKPARERHRARPAARKAARTTAPDARPFTPDISIANLPQKLGPKGSGGLPGCVVNAGSLLGFSFMSLNDEQSPDEPLGTETFEQGDEALDEESRLDPDFLEDVERDPSLDPTLLVDERELEEAGATFDDAEAMAILDGGIDDPDGVGLPREGRIRNGDDEGWDLDA